MLLKTSLKNLSVVLETIKHIFASYFCVCTTHYFSIPSVNQDSLEMHFINTALHGRVSLFFSMFP